MRAALTLLATLLVGIASAQSNVCLIGQPNLEGGIAMDLANPLASELDRIGQVTSIVYSITDPIIRDAVNDGKIGKPSERPTIAEINEAARVIKAGQVIWLEPLAPVVDTRNKKQRGFRAALTLFRNGKKAWADEQSLQVSVGGNDATLTTAVALASSFAEGLGKGPFKDLPKSAKSAGTEVGKGQAPIIPETNDDDPELNDFAAVMQRVKDLLSQGRVTSAEILLRDAVDAAPKDANRRKELINLLQAYGRTDDAIAVTLASGTALGDPNLAPLAARIMLDAGRQKDAQAILNDAVATNPNSGAVRIMLAEVRLRESAPEQALKHLEFAIKAEPTAEAFAMRALARALLGAEDGVKLDLDRVAKDAPTLADTLYPRWASIFDAALTVEAPDLRSLLQKAVLNRKSEEVADLIDAQERLAKASILFLGENPANLRYEKSHANRLLAMNLLIQSMSELRTYTTKGDEDSLSEARIDFGEMLKALENAKKEFAQESKDARNAVVYRDSDYRLFGGISSHQSARS